MAGDAKEESQRFCRPIRFDKNGFAGVSNPMGDRDLGTGERIH